MKGYLLNRSQIIIRKLTNLIFDKSILGLQAGPRPTFCIFYTKKRKKLATFSFFRNIDKCTKNFNFILNFLIWSTFCWVNNLFQVLLLLRCPRRGTGIPTLGISDTVVLRGYHQLVRRWFVFCQSPPHSNNGRETIQNCYGIFKSFI